MRNFLDCFESCIGREELKQSTEEKATHRTLPPPPPITEFTVNTENNFAVEAFKAALETCRHPSKNLVICPYSAELVLAALFPGTDGELHAALAQLLCPDGRSFSDLVTNLQAVNTDGALNSANAVFYDDHCRLASQYRETVETSIQCGFIPTPFQDAPDRAVDIVNQFVAEKTEGKITAFLTESRPNAALILINIIDFAGQWTAPFNPQDTKQNIFHCPGGVEKTVSFMKEERACIRHYNVLDYARAVVEVGDPKIIVMDVKGRKFSVMILLPADNSADGMRQLVEMLTIQRLLSWLKKSEPDCPPYILLPKFRIRCSTDLILTTMKLGLDQMYAPSAGNFSRMMDDGKEMKIDEFTQEVILDLDEYGVKATAVSACRLVCHCLREPQPDFVADRPFLVVIWNEVVGVPVFIGQINDPTE
ncbi:serpin B8-like [Paramacrobiotus metropolitanus]|uniref:serpin B8-like n=1 Tax=Paramacrobiotus metropolitanus TaxID=2943436 RepID=UPI0024461571|nr:serpin B8-like [Paramacrobiotus metropolitanus]